MDDLDMEAYKLLIDPTPPASLRGSRPASKMKPNTRFLSHIVREAKSHNAALLARETADAQKRLKKLNGEDGDSSEDDRNDRDRSRRRRDTRKSNDDSTRADDRHRRQKRHRDDDSDDDGKKRDGKHRDKSSRSHRDHHRSSRHRDSSRENREREREKKDRERDRESRSRRHLDRSRDREPKDGEVDKVHGSSRHKHRERSKSPSRHSRRRSASPRSSKRSHRDRGHDPDQDRARGFTKDRSLSDMSVDDESDYSSDPLDEFVGPKLASDHLQAAANDTGIRIRGRGARTAATPGFATSSMDRHFAADYDPTNDVEHPIPQARPQVAPRQPTSNAAEEAGDEMKEDRKKLLRDNAERLKAAGFTDKEIAILSRGGRRRLDNSPWAKKGEEREWDRDKVEGNEGPAKPVWAR